MPEKIVIPPLPKGARLVWVVNADDYDPPAYPWPMAVTDEDGGGMCYGYSIGSDTINGHYWVSGAESASIDVFDTLPEALAAYLAVYLDSIRVAEQRTARWHDAEGRMCLADPNCEACGGSGMITDPSQTFAGRGCHCTGHVPSKEDR